MAKTIKATKVTKTAKVQAPKGAKTPAPVAKVETPELTAAQKAWVTRRAAGNTSASALKAWETRRAMKAEAEAAAAAAAAAEAKAAKGKGRKQKAA